MGLTEDLATGHCGPFYLLISSEEYLRVDAQRRWLAVLEAQAARVVHRFRAPRWDLAELENVLMTLPMFGDSVAVVLHDIEKTHPAHQERLASLLAARGAHVFVLATAGAIDKRTRFYKSLDGLGPVEEFGRIYDDQRPGWVHRIAGDLGWVVSGEAAAAIAELVGDDLMGYEAELKKIILFIGTPRRIEKDDIDRVLFADSRYGDFAITDALGRRDLPRTLRVMRQTFLGGGTRTGWMSLVVGTLFRFLSLKAMGQSKTDREIAAELGLNPYVVKLLRVQAERFSREQLLEGIRLLYQVERDVKSSVLPGLLASELFLIRFLRASEAVSEG